MSNIFGISVWMLIKIAALVLMSLYIVFAFIIVRQVRIMTSTLQLGFEGPIKFISYIHLIFAVFVFLTALIVL